MSRKPAAKSVPDPLARYRSKRDFTKTPEPPPEADETPHHRAAAGAAPKRGRKAADAAGTTPRRDRKAAIKDPTSARDAPRFVIQKHWARRLHYDFRLEIAGTMKSWAVPKGPSLDPKVKRMAVHVEDHPISYNNFEGTIPAGQYGAGEVIIWDRGHWLPDEDATKAYQAGKLKFELQGIKLRGRWALVRMGGKRGASASRSRGKDASSGAATATVPNDGSLKDGDDAWLLIKEQDDRAVAESELIITEAMPDSVTRAAPKEPAKSAGPMPESLAPQLATRVSAAPGAVGWVYELKYDGYRILARMAGGRVRLHTRQGHDWTDRLPALAQAMESQSLPDGWYDGEIIVADADGRPDFQALQNAFDGGNASDVVFYLFDLPWLLDEDLRRDPLVERQRRLAEILEATDHPALRLSAAFDIRPDDMLESACRLGLEGIIGKRAGSPYVSGRSGHWIKLKCSERQEFVIGGYTDPKGGRRGLGALLLGYYDDAGQLRYAGNVGSGFTDASLQSLHQRLQPLHQDRSPFSDVSRMAQVHWVRPELAAEVAFSQWTGSGRVRHAVFQGLRDDKPTKLMKKETSTSISNADRVVDAKSGTVKGDIAAYYERVAPLMVPHLRDRPVSMMRAPEGVGGETFFQKHMEADKLKGIRNLDPKLDPGHDPLVVIDDGAGLAAAAQLNVIEFHTWNAVSRRIDRPDRISFDLDPGEGVKWPAMQEAAFLLRNFLEELELDCFVKTSGGKGLHVLVPIIRRYDWDTVKGFSKAVVQHMADVLPQRFSAKSGPRNRVGKIFIDYLRNGFGATTVAAWSLRARPGMGVSVPILWDEVETLRGGDHWTVRNIDERLSTGNAPWDGYENSAQALGPAMKRLGYAKPRPRA